MCLYVAFDSAKCLFWVFTDFVFCFRPSNCEDGVQQWPTITDANAGAAWSHGATNSWWIRNFNTCHPISTTSSSWKPNDGQYQMITICFLLATLSLHNDEPLLCSRFTVGVEVIMGWGKVVQMEWVIQWETDQASWWLKMLWLCEQICYQSSMTRFHAKKWHRLSHSQKGLISHCTHPISVIETPYNNSFWYQICQCASPSVLESRHFLTLKRGCRLGQIGSPSCSKPALFVH